MADKGDRWQDVLLRALRAAVGRGFIVFAILVLNPFGIVEWGDLRSRHLWQQIFADRYGGETQKGRNHVTLVDLDRVSLDSLAPVATGPDSIHLLNVFRTLNNQVDVGGTGKRPRAIFIDLLLESYAPDGYTQADLLDFDRFGDGCPEALDNSTTYSAGKEVSPFACMVLGIAEMTRYEAWRDRPECVTGNPVRKLVCITGEGGTPVLIADPSDPRVQKAGRTSAGAAALAAVAIPVPVMVNEQYYPLVHPPKASDRANKPYDVYPAALLYAAYCLDGGDCGALPVVEPDPAEARKSGAAWKSTHWDWSPPFERPMEVIWGVGSKDRFTNLVDTVEGGTLEQKCRVADRSQHGTSGAFLRALFSGIQVERQDPCSYQHALNYSLLRWGGRAGTDVKPLRDEALAGKIVLIGMSTPDSNDFIAAGPHGQLPGVFYHAMALDNLIEHGSSYSPHPHRLWPPLTVTDQDLQNTSIALLLLFFGSCLVLFEKRRAEQNAKLTFASASMRTALLVVCATMVLLLVIFLFTGVVIPDRFNFVALTVVALLELIKIIAALSRPIVYRLAENNSIVRSLLGDPQIPRSGPSGGKGSHAGTASRAPRSRRKPRRDGVQDLPTDPV